jgi:hypothetical protein
MDKKSRKKPKGAYIYKSDKSTLFRNKKFNTSKIAVLSEKCIMDQLFYRSSKQSSLFKAIYIIIWLSLYVLSVHSLSPPKPTGLDPPNFRRRTLYYMRKSLGIKVFFFFGIFFGIFFWKIYFKFFWGFIFGFFSMKTRSVVEQPASVFNMATLFCIHCDCTQPASAEDRRG